jgi:hypothetical protein
MRRASRERLSAFARLLCAISARSDLAVSVLWWRPRFVHAENNQVRLLLSKIHAGRVEITACFMLTKPLRQIASDLLWSSRFGEE